jgi:hypothetical protein
MTKYEPYKSIHTNLTFIRLNNGGELTNNLIPTLSSVIYFITCNYNGNVHLIETTRGISLIDEIFSREI